ncbi:hypothetical protein D8I24_6519 [Cupriavidus necator H850]|jgi:hypothetical protein|uniref:DUF6148 family protein n=1 Tax=Cupriavidus TaxID=106589 RepID=UPI00129E4F0F|nr:MULTISPECIES: DUF6148 family protein [Cupriavidus]KAI3597703.1 hypothetical protein D8I24_6519 [Cupriavidus necator H850]QUN29537.1 hypothetical protein KB879_06205 [Cupriavidus sp. KK10]
MITAEQAQQQLDLWLAASSAVAKNQAYTIGGRSFTRVDAAEIRQQIDYWEGKLRVARRGGRRMTIGYGVAE